MTTSPAQLDYAPAPPRWRKWIRRGIAIVLLLGFGLTAWRWGPEGWRRAQVLYWQRECERYTMPPDRVVYEEDPQEAARLLAGTEYATYPIARNGPTISAAAASDPNCWQKYTPALTPAFFSAIIGSGAGRTGAFVFLHERTSPSGHRRIVRIHYAPDSFTSAFVEGYNYSDDVITPATFTKPPSRAMHFEAFDVLSGFPRHAPAVRMFAGQIDPNDSSHFTIRYQMWGQEDVLDGRLNDDDSVSLTPRKQLQEPNESR